MKAQNSCESDYREAFVRLLMRHDRTISAVVAARPVANGPTLIEQLDS